jgi:hypothetical protein
MQKISLILFNLDQFSIHGNTGWHRKIVRLVAINGEVLLVLVVPRCIQLAFLMFPILTARAILWYPVLQEGRSEYQVNLDVDFAGYFGYFMLLIYRYNY